MSRLAYYPTPATRRLGTLTLDARPSTCPHFATPFTISQTAKRWSGSLGVWGIGTATALVFVRLFSHLLSHTALSERRPGSFCDAQGEKHVSPQNTHGASLAFLTSDSSRPYAPHSSVTTTRTRPLPRTSHFKLLLP
jgi:hypothetical protein